MPRGGYRPGSGRPKGAKKDKSVAACEREAIVEAAKSDMTPLDYMLMVMRNPEEPKDRRDKMAIAAAPYVHGKASEKMGKKQEKAEAAKEASKGRFKAMEGPKVVSIK